MLIITKIRRSLLNLTKKLVKFGRDLFLLATVVFSSATANFGAWQKAKTSSSCQNYGQELVNFILVNIQLGLTETEKIHKALETQNKTQNPKSKWEITWKSYRPRRDYMKSLHINETLTNWNDFLETEANFDFWSG